MARGVLFLVIFLSSLIIAIYPNVAAQESCVGNLPPRLVPGERGRVLAGDANRLRAEPSLEGEQITMILSGDAFDVIDGPVCADGYTWWQVEYQGDVGWTAEGSPEEYWVEPLDIPSEVGIPEPEGSIDEDDANPLVTEIPGGWLVNHTTWLGHTAFIVSDELATDITFEIIENPRPDAEPESYNIYLNPTHVEYTLVDYPDYENSFMYPPRISLYPADEFRASEELNTERFAPLEKILDTQKVTGEIPRVPSINAAQLMVARVEFLEMENGTGVRYITHYGQDIWVPDNHIIIYEFVGLADDGRVYIHAAIPIDVSYLRETFDFSEFNMRTYEEDFPTLIAEEVKKLNAADPSDFIPPLEDLDAIFETMLIEEAE